MKVETARIDNLYCCHTKASVNLSLLGVGRGTASGGGAAASYHQLRGELGGVVTDKVDHVARHLLVVERQREREQRLRLAARALAEQPSQLRHRPRLQRGCRVRAGRGGPPSRCSGARRAMATTGGSQRRADCLVAHLVGRGHPVAIGSRVAGQRFPPWLVALLPKVLLAVAALLLQPRVAAVASSPRRLRRRLLLAQADGERERRLS